MQTIRCQLSITLDEQAGKALAEVLGPALRRAATLPPTDIDERRDARLRASQHANFGGQKPPEDQGLLINSREAAKLLKVSERTLWGWQDSHKIPPPIRIGKSVRWSVDALRKWVNAGCPPERD